MLLLVLVFKSQHWSQTLISKKSKEIVTCGILLGVVLHRTTYITQRSNIKTSLTEKPK